MLTERDKVHLQKLFQKYDKTVFEQLRPPPCVYEIAISEQTHFINNGLGKKKRFIYYGVPYLTEEQLKISQVKMKMADANILQIYPDEIILKHLYAVEFNVQECLQRLRKLQAFQNNQIVTTFTEQTAQLLNSGCIYTYGHDKGMKPIVILRADKFDYSKNIFENYNPVYFLMLTVLGFRTVRMYAEKYITIFDLCQMNFTQIPYKYLYEVFTGMNLYYCGNVQKTYIFNAKGIGSLWTFMKGFIPQASRKKIIFIDSTNQQQILNQIDAEELQKRYGGKLANLQEFWPPKVTNQQFDALQKNLKLKQNQQEMTNSQFFSVNNDVQYFVEKGDGVCGQTSCQCNIF